MDKDPAELTKTDLMNEIQRRNERSRELRNTPHVGIFWVYDGRLLIVSAHLERPADAGGFIDYPEGHDTEWEFYRRSRIVPRNIEYDEPPRGRVVYDLANDKFLFYADRCILTDVDRMNEIKSELHLPAAKTVVNSDEHYRCSVCLGLKKK